MGRMVPQMMPEYYSDLNILYKNFRFKIKDAPTYVRAFGSCGNYEAPLDLPCNTNFLLEPRKLIVTFKDGMKMEFPVYKPAEVTKCAEKILKHKDVICLDYEGEEWYVIPPTVGKYKPKKLNYELPRNEKAEKISGYAKYESDALGDTVVKFAVEKAPDAVSKIGLACLPNREEPGCNFGAVIKGRHVIFKAKGAAVKAGSEVFHQQKIVRKFQVADLKDLCTCIRRLGNESECVGYKGESIRNLHLLLGPLSQCGSAGSGGGSPGGAGSNTPQLPPAN